MVRLVHKKRLKSPQKSPILENQAICFGSFLQFPPKLPFWLFWPAISKPGWTRRKKVPLGIRFKSTRPSYMRIWPEPNPPEARQSFLRPGLSAPLWLLSRAALPQTTPHTRGRKLRARPCAGRFCMAGFSALTIELSTPGFSNSRIRARPHVYPRSPGPRPSLQRGLNEEFYF